jgi:copper chaperone CopZ
MAEIEALRGAEIVHAVRGRLRLRLPREMADDARMEAIRRALTSIAGVEIVEVRPASASVVVVYDPEEHDDLEGFLAAQSLRSLPPPPQAAPNGSPKPRHHSHSVPDLGNPSHHHRPPPNKIAEAADSIAAEAEFLAEHSHAAKVVVDFAKTLDRKLKQATNNNVDLKILVPIGLAAVTVFEIGAAAATPMWMTLVLFSINHFVELHAHEDDDDDDAEPGEGLPQ